MTVSDVLDVENMTILSECPNTPTDEEPDYDDADPPSLQMLAQDYYPVNLERRDRIFKFVKGKNGTTPFLPSKERTGGKIQYIPNKETMCLAEG